MFDQIRQLVYSDKIFQHPVLGKVSCGAFSDTLTECKNDPCLQLKQLTSQCYGGKDVQEVKTWIDAQFEQSLMMMKFLRQRHSTLPEKLTRNTWAVFTNATNLDKFERLSVPNP